MTSTAQVEANRRNAQHSCGPKTPEGKARAARNALTHGLTAKSAVLPQEEPAAFDALCAAWLDDWRPQGETEHTLVERASLATWRLNRCLHAETARLATLSRHAAETFERTELARALKLGRQLMADPLHRMEVPFRDEDMKRKFDAWLAIEPADVVRELESFAQGVQWLLIKWSELLYLLQNEGFWHYPERNTAIRMFGRCFDEVLNDEAVEKIFLNCAKLHPEAWDMHDDVQQACLGRFDRPPYYFRIDRMAKRGPKTREEAMTFLVHMVLDEMARLEQLKRDILDPMNELDRADAADRAICDVSKEAVLARRYETACERELHKALADLTKLRKDRARESIPAAEPEPLRNEPILRAEPLRNEPNVRPEELRNEPNRRERRAKRRDVRAQKMARGKHQEPRPEAVRSVHPVDIRPENPLIS